MKKDTALALLGELINTADFLAEKPYHTDVRNPAKKWLRSAHLAIKNIFGAFADSKLSDFNTAVAGLQKVNYDDDTVRASSISGYRMAIEGGKTELEMFADEISKYWPEDVQSSEDDVFPWNLLHPEIERTSRKLFEGEHYAQCVLASLLEINNLIKKRVEKVLGKEFDGATLMNRAFSQHDPILIIGNLATESGKSMQQGYMQIFAGAMTGIRNPKAHENLDLDENRAIHFLFLASLLMFKIDEAKEPT